MTNSRVVATAGHVDHGKSTLVRTLTGTDPDRFEEEKRRGLTIDLGFAHTVLPSGSTISFIDVPGHVRFLKNMLAGVGAVDACLFVVAATEGWKPQSEEHLRILELLGISHGVVALTKLDAVDEEWAELARLDVLDHVAGTFLDDADVVAVSAATGAGLDDLRRALDDLLAATPPAADRQRPRLWVDRVFAARGSGTVVTGTLTGGSLGVGDHLDMVDAAAGRVRPVRIRALQHHGHGADSVEPGNRVAVNVTGIERGEVARGDALVRVGQWRPSATVDCSLEVLSALDHPVSRRGAYVAYIGSGEAAVKVRILGNNAIEPGGTGSVRIHLPAALPLLPGDRFVLRESGRAETVGGGEVLDVAPIRPASKARPDRSVERVVAERGWIGADELDAITGERRPPTLGRWVVAPGLAETLADDVVRRIGESGGLGLDLATLDEREREALSLAPTGVVEITGGRARAAAIVDPLAGHAFVRALEIGRFVPPGADEVERGELRLLVQRGLVIERDGVWFHPATIEAGALIAAKLLVDRPDGFTMAELRDALATTRKFVLPLAAELDARGITRRRGDVRIAGPRLPTV